MKRRSIALAVLLGTAGLGVMAAAPAASAAPAPVTSWSPTTSPGTYDYGTLTAGQSASQTFTLTNSGGSATSKLTITLTGSAAFTMTANTCTAPASLGPGKSCTVTVSYAPATTGANDSGTLTATANKADATASLTLKGSAKASPVLSTTPGPGGPAGTPVTDTITLSGGSDPTGEIAVNLYGPSATPDCSGTPVTSEPDILFATGDGSYTTTELFTPSQPGTYWWAVSYSGDAHNNAVSSTCGDEQVVMGQGSPVLSTTPGPGGPAGTPVTDTITLSGGSDPTGEIAVNLYGPSATPDCSGTPVTSEPDILFATGDGSYTTTELFTPSQPGTYWWAVSYSGDAHNNAVSSTCGDEQVVMGQGSPVLSTTPGPGGPAGTPVTDTITLSGGSDPTGEIAVNLYGPSATPDCSGTPVTSEPDILFATGDGSYTTTELFTPSQPGTYWWAVSYSGDAHNNAVSSTCGDEQVVMGQGSPVLSTTPGPGGPAGTPVTDTITLSGGSDPTGEIAVNLYGPSATPDCSGTPVTSEPDILFATGDGSYTTTELFTPSQPGTYWWAVSYSGDAHNNAVSSTCGDEQVVIG